MYPTAPCICISSAPCIPATVGCAGCSHLAGWVLGTAAQTLRKFRPRVNQQPPPATLPTPALLHCTTPPWGLRGLLRGAWGCTGVYIVGWLGPSRAPWLWCCRCGQGAVCTVDSRLPDSCSVAHYPAPAPGGDTCQQLPDTRNTGLFETGHSIALYTAFI